MCTENRMDSMGIPDRETRRLGAAAGVAYAPAAAAFWGCKRLSPLAKPPACGYDETEYIVLEGFGLDTPVYDFLKRYESSGTARFHMPGHKGDRDFVRAFPGAGLDITEIAGADSLYEADGILLESEQNAGALYGSKTTVFSAGGSTLCIQAMLLLTVPRGSKILCGRNAHSSFYNMLALLDLRPVWLLPRFSDGQLVSGTVETQQVVKALEENPDAAAVYLTSPDYLGGQSDVAGIAAVCKTAGVPLLVDNAHGAHLKFLPGPRGYSDGHPITLGASMCCDSAHKTLPALTGAAYLHSNLPVSRQQIKDAMAMFGSTSPSYLILSSLDRLNVYLKERAREDFAALSRMHGRLCRAAVRAGFGLPAPGADCTKLTLSPRPLGASGPEFAAYLRELSIEPEYVGPDCVVFLMTPMNSREEFLRLAAALEDFPAGVPLPESPVEFVLPPVGMTPAQAAFSAAEHLPVEQSLGRVCAQVKIACPPGVPVVCPGEEITNSVQKLLQNSGIRTVKVVK